jgi:hypothetical protein
VEKAGEKVYELLKDMLSEGESERKGDEWLREIPRPVG